MSRDTFDAVLASTPQGPVAGRVTARGTHYTPDVNFGTYAHWDAPPPLKPLPRPYPGATFIDLTGRKFGRFTVVGYLGRLNPKNKKKSHWLVRCVCGDYETRHGPAITAANPLDECRVCRDLKVKRKRYEKQGARPISDFFTEVKAP